MYTPLTDDEIAAQLGLTVEELAEFESCYDCAGAGCSTCDGEPMTGEEVDALLDGCAPFDARLWVANAHVNAFFVTVRGLACGLSS